MFELPPNWRWSTVSRIAAKEKYACVGGPFGSKLSRKHYVEAPGVPVVRGQNLRGPDRQFIDADFVFLSEDKADTLLSNMAYPGDLVFTQRGTLGQVGRIPTEARFERYVISQSQMKITVDGDVADPDFIYAFFRSRWALDYIARTAITTGVPHINLGILREFPVPVPPLREQRRIAAVLGALDDKIELNRRMNRTLEEMAQAIFKSWFIDFDGHDDLVDSELGPIPRAWEVGRLGDCLTVIETGKRPKGGVAKFTSGIPSVGAESIVGIGQFDFSKTTYIPPEFFEGLKKGVVQDRDVLIYKDESKPGDFRPHVTLFGNGFPFETFAINSHVYRLRAERVSQEFLYFWLSSPSMMAEMRRRGTGAAIPGIPRRNLVSMPLLVPAPVTLAEFQNFAAPAVSRILANANQSQTLAELRDTLLPKLISGELRVPEAEDTVVEALS